MRKAIYILGLFVLLVLGSGCNTLYQIALFRDIFGHEEDDFDTFPFIGAWNDLAPLPDTRESACDIVGTSIYLCGGQNSSGALDSILAYDTAGDTWSAALCSLPAPTSGHVCVTLDDKIYIFGGSSAAAWAYDPSNDSIAAVAAPEATFYAAACACEGKIYYFGGALASGYTVASTQVYNPGSDTWSAAADMIQSLAGAFCQQVGGKIYLIGGYHNPSAGPADYYTDTTFEYQPTPDLWVPRAPMTYPRAYGASGVVNGRVIVLGGFDGSYPGIEHVESYNPVRDSWRKLWHEPFARSFTCGATLGRRIFVFGGRIGSSTYTVQAREFISP